MIWDAYFKSSASCSFVLLESVGQGGCRGREKSEGKGGVRGGRTAGRKDEPTDRQDLIIAWAMQPYTIIIQKTCTKTTSSSSSVLS